MLSDTNQFRLKGCSRCIDRNLLGFGRKGQKARGYRSSNTEQQVIFRLTSETLAAKIKKENVGHKNYSSLWYGLIDGARGPYKKIFVLTFKAT